MPLDSGRSARAVVLFSVALGVALLALGCDGSAERVVPTAQMLPGRFALEISAFGELEAANSTSIESPRGLRGQQRIAWIAEDGTRVDEGEIVVTLDAADMQQRMQKHRDEIRKFEWQLEQKNLELQKEASNLEGDLVLLRRELTDAEQTAPKDEELFSRHEIVEAAVDIDLIETKIAHREREQSRGTEKAKAELDILRLQSQQEQMRLDRLEEGMAQLEVKAPHGGVFVRGRSWQGEKMRVGHTMWGGQTLGEIPDVSTMQAKIWVLESEAAGLAEGLSAKITLDAHPDITVDGNVKTIQPIANPLDRQSPVKYFEVVLDLERTLPEVMKPASQVRARVFVADEEEVLSVPNQAIFGDGGKSWIFVQQGASFEKREVTTGQRSVTRTVIEGGLQPGDVIALVDPTADTGAG